MYKFILKEHKKHSPFTAIGTVTGIIVMLISYNISSNLSYNIFYTNAHKEVGGGYPWKWDQNTESITQGSDQIFYFIIEDGQSNSKYLF
ncbi:MAG: hypothetical protein FJW69_04980 [Actinobacteria bacterium]|nr:hypothetical protein [Actinomycetota bacterium]MBM3712628.1 hypothetical protein [Actinomycetota bacterium]